MKTNYKGNTPVFAGFARINYPEISKDGKDGRFGHVLATRERGKGHPLNT